jgi:glucan endo-1,3-alpha-glucosidase
MLLATRDQISQVEIISWNDVSTVDQIREALIADGATLFEQYGESHYINVINGDQPPESKVWTMNPDSMSCLPIMSQVTITPTFSRAIVDHTPYLSLQAFYSAAWKNGAVPAITQDKVWLTARPHTMAAIGTADSVPRPDGWDLVSTSTRPFLLVKRELRPYREIRL